MNEQSSTFTSEEDYILTKLVRMFGIKKWKIITLYFNKIFPEINQNNKSLKEQYI